MNPLINPGISAILKQMKKNRETDSEKKLYDVLFLDYDGVINIVNKNYSIDRFESRRMENINRLCREFGLKIVVTSSWRLFPNYGELLYENGLDPDIEVLGCTESTGPRETEIKNYLMQHIYINKLKNGEDVKFVTCWGRGDFQKAFDETIEGFKRYVYNTGDDNVVLVMGGDLNIDKTEGKIFKDKVALFVKDEKLQDKMLTMDDFVPGRAMAQVSDCVIVASRTAPCELVDLEGKQHLCTPIVANGQGLKQKNFDPGIPEEAQMADAFRTKHQFFDSREEMLKAASDDVKANFNKVVEPIKKKIETKYKVALGKEIPAETLEKFLEVNPDYKNALRMLRDEVMADDIAEALKRCLIDHRDDDVARTILKNQINGKYGWEENQAITRSEVSTGDLYRSDFKKQATNVENKDVIGHGAKVPESRIKTKIIETSFWGRCKNWANSRGGKWTLGIAGGAAVISGLGYVGYKTGWLDPKFADKKKHGHLSRIG